MIITNTPNVHGKEISESLGVVRGNTVRARNFGSDWLAGIKTFIGGEIGEYTSLLTQAREQALERMIAEASELGADAVVNVRFSTSDVLQGTAEILVYGTAVKLK